MCRLGPVGWCPALCPDQQHQGQGPDGRRGERKGEEGGEGRQGSEEGRGREREGSEKGREQEREGRGMRKEGEEGRFCHAYTCKASFMKLCIHKIIMFLRIK